MMERVESKKIGIVTITNGPDNYGNVLQNYALQVALRKMGYDSETISNISFAEYRANYLYLILKYIVNRRGTQKSIKFEKFKHAFIKYSRQKYKRNNKAIHNLKDKYYKFVCGSDQIWNPDYGFNTNWEIGLLRFADDSQKIAYAASFGVERLAESSQQIMFKNELAKFKAISVRENSAAEIVNSLIGEKPPVVLDPTLLLNVDEWNNVARPVSGLLNTDYVLVYVLGDKNNKIQEYINSCDEQIRKSVLIDVMNPDKSVGIIGPSEFIWLIQNAKLVITDSFHATVFSILYAKNFMVFKRKGEKASTGDRLNTLLSLFTLNDHILLDDELIKTTPVDKNRIEPILEDEKKRSFLFLEKALNE